MSAPAHSSGDNPSRSRFLFPALALLLCAFPTPAHAHDPGEERPVPLEHFNNIKFDEWIDCLPDSLNPANCGDPDGWTVEEAADLLSAYPNLYLWMGNNSRRPPGSPDYTRLADYVNALQEELPLRGVDPKRVMVDFRPEVYGKFLGYPWAGDMDGSKGDTPFDTDWVFRVPVGIHEQIIQLWTDAGSGWPDPFDPPGAWPANADVDALLALNTPTEVFAGYGVRTPENGMRISSVIVDLSNPAYRAWRARYLLYKIEDYGLTPGEPFSVLLSYKPGVHTWWDGGDLGNPQIQPNYLEFLPDGTPTYSYGMQLPVSYGGPGGARNVFPTQYGQGVYEQAVSDFVEELTQVIHEAGYDDFDILMHDSAIYLEPWYILDDRTKKNLHVQGDVATSFKAIGERAAPHAAPQGLQVLDEQPDFVDLAWSPPVGPPASYDWLTTGFEDDVITGDDDDPAGLNLNEPAPENVTVVAGSSTGGSGANAQILRVVTGPDAWWGASISFAPIDVNDDRALQFLRHSIKVRVDDTSLPTHIRPVRVIGRTGNDQVLNLALQPSVTAGDTAGFYVEEMATTGPYQDLANVPLVPEVRQGDWYRLNVDVNFLNKQVTVSVTNLDSADPDQSSSVIGWMRMEVDRLRSVVLSVRRADPTAASSLSFDDWHTEVTDIYTGYTVLRDGVDYDTIGLAPSAYRDTGVTPNTTHTYRVRMVGQRNAGGLPGNEVSATTPTGAEVCDDGADNDGDGDADCDDSDCFTDADTDGVPVPPCGTDCDDDNLLVWSPPGPVIGLRWNGRQTLLWDDPGFGSGGATAYQIVRGLATQLPVGSGAQEICLEPEVAATTYDDPTPMGSGTLYYYLVRGDNTCAPAGGIPYGLDSEEADRVSAACP